MGVVGEVIEYFFDLIKVFGCFIERRMVWVFSFCIFFVEECFEMVYYVEFGKKFRWGYFFFEGYFEVMIRFEGIKVIFEFLQVIVYEVYVKNVIFGFFY